jgi:hypothetical protein
LGTGECAHRLPGEKREPVSGVDARWLPLVQLENLTIMAVPNYRDDSLDSDTRLEVELQRKL